MEATFGLLQCFCSATVTHSPPPPPAPPPPVHLLCSHPNYQHRDQSLCNYTFPPAAAITPQIRSGTKQSMAARERRRKITAKTQELGKLIPGGDKMNTAEMLQAASKYVKFLRAQLALLQKIQIPPSSSTYGHRYHQHNPMELPVFLASSAVQEKLYSEDMCLAPKQLLHHLS